MSRARRIFYKSTIALALTAAFGQVVIAQEHVGENGEKFVSLVIRKPVQLERPKQAIAMSAGQVITTSADQAIVTRTSQDSAMSDEQDIAIALAPYPGVYVTKLLPNGRFNQISAGGSMPFGVSGVAIVEDGINHAPLAYLDNSVSNLSMASVESINVLDSAQSAFGPNGLGGVISITRDQISSKAADGALELGYGTHQQSLVDLNFGGQKDDWGNLVSLNRQQGDSYRVNRNQQSGDYSANDFMVRIKEIAPPLKKNWQQTELKVQYKDYQNNESRFGISRDDLATNPMLRYMATAQDNERQEQLNVHLKHHNRLDYDELVTTDIYYNDGEASYYQTVAVNGLFGDNAARALGAFEQMPIGSVGIEKYGLDRHYTSWGVQFQVEQQIERHNILLGIRHHTESLNDLLWSDSFSMDSQFSLSKLDIESGVASYKDTARVRSLFLSDRWQSGLWHINVGVRHEKINMRREATNIVGDALGESKQSITLLSTNANYRINDNWRFILSGHQGYQPARSSTSVVKAQESQIVRAGVGYDSANITVSAIAFYNVFDNLLGDCRGAAGCINGQHNFGRAKVNGAELAIKTQAQLGHYMLPIQLAFTHNDGEFSRDFDSTVLGWQINSGDILPYLPRNQLYLNVGLAAARWQFNAQVHYRDVQRTAPGIGFDNSAEILDDVTLLNIDASYQVATNQYLHLTVKNATDEVYAESSFNAGVLAGTERTISASYQVRF